MGDEKAENSYVLKRESSLFEVCFRKTGEKEATVPGEPLHRRCLTLNDHDPRLPVAHLWNGEANAAFSLHAEGVSQVT